MNGLLNGKITGVSRMRMDIDGRGLTTLVGMYGCPLQCQYCINGYSRQDRGGTILSAEFSAEELVEILSMDETYFRMTGGGVVFGGGEPLLQAKYLAEVCEKIQGRYDIRIETSLHVPWEQIEVLLPYVTQWIVDIKDVNPNIYEAYTGQKNDVVLENLKKLSKCVDEEKVWVRVPKIPEYNNGFDVLCSKWKVQAMGLHAEVFTYKED